MKKTHTLRRVVVASVLAGLGISAIQAQGVPSAPYLSVPQRCAFLVSNPYIVKQLNLTPVQTRAVQHALKQYDAVSDKLAKLKEPSEKEAASNDIKLANAYLTALTPPQKDVILRLGIQQLGTEALLDPSVVAKLGLDGAQAKRISAIYHAYAKRAEDVDAMEGDAMVAIPQPKAGADQTAYNKKKLDVYASYEGERQRIQREKSAADKKILAVMTPAQSATWIKLSAVPVKKRK
jgi:hypothetical protein